MSGQQYNNPYQPSSHQSAGVYSPIANETETETEPTYPQQTFPQPHPALYSQNQVQAQAQAHAHAHAQSGYQGQGQSQGQGYAYPPSQTSFKDTYSHNPTQTKIQPVYPNVNDNGSYERQVQTAVNTTTTTAHHHHQQPQQPQQAHPGVGIMKETDEELTEDEFETYNRGIVNWNDAKNWRWWFRKQWLWYYLIFAVLIVLVALMAFYHAQIVNWLTPVTRTFRTLKAGWLVPVAIIFVLSFPPLFGQEIVMVLVGVVWGLGVGFAIVAAGTLLGEIGNYFLFKYWCRERAYRMTRKNFPYACLSQAISDGGFFVALIVRLSAIPTHFSTAVMAVCGMTLLNFTIAAVLSLPKQLIAVYVGVVLGETNPTTNSKVISDSVFGVTAVITVLALWFIYNRMMASRKRVLLEMRKDLQAKDVAVTMPAGYDETADGETQTQTHQGRDFRHPFRGPNAIHGR